MKTYEIELDVTITYRTKVQANSEEEAKKMAEDEAYQDTFSCDATFSHCKVYQSEVIEKG